MIQRRFLIPVVVLLLSALLAACGGGGDDSGDNGSSDNGDNSSQQTGGAATNAASGEAATASAELANGGTITVTLPAGWVWEEGENVILAANEEAALGADATGIGEGQISVQIDYILDDSERAEAIGISSSTVPVNAKRSFEEALNNNEDGVVYELGNPALTIVRGAQVGLSTGTVTVNDDTTAGAILLIQQIRREGYVEVVAITPEGDEGNYNDEMRAIGASLDYTAP